MVVRNYKVYCYLRLSELEAKEQKCRKKLDKFIETNNIYVDEIIEEIISGSVAANNRERFNSLLSVIRRDDILITLRLLDLGRYYSETHDIVSFLNDKGVKLCILNLPYFNDWLFIQDKRIYHMSVDLLQHLLIEMIVLEKKNKAMSVKIGMTEALAKGKAPGRPIARVPATFKKTIKSLSQVLMEECV